MKNPKVVLAAMAIVFAGLKILAAFAFIPSDQTLYQLGFSFGDYIESLHTTGRLELCRLSFCAYAMRMPLIPWLYHLLAYISDQALVAGLIKNVLMSLVVVVAFRRLLSQQGLVHHKAEVPWIWLLPLVVFSPAVIKHASAVTYEEGILIELVFLWAVSFMLSARLLASGRDQAGPAPVVLNLALATTIFMAKSSMLPLLLASAGITLIDLFARRRLPSLIALGVALALVLGWGARNESVSGRFSIMTSWDGENMYRGASDIGYALYPDVMLDRIFDASEFHMRDGRVITNTPLGSIGAFKQEWRWNDHYRDLAVSWVKNNPEKALSYTGHKLFNFFLSVEKTPYQYQSDGSEISARFSTQNLLTSAWLGIGRLLELAMAVLLIWLLRQGTRAAWSLALAVIVVNGAYAAPYVLGFNYERHITTYLVIVAACVAFLLAEWREHRGTGRTRT